MIAPAYRSIAEPATRTETATKRKKRELKDARIILPMLWANSFGRPWPKTRGLTSWSAYKALCWLGWRHGHFTVPEGEPYAGERVEDGVRVGISTRDWADLCGCGREAIHGAQAELIQAGLIRRDGPRRNGTKAGAFVILVAPLGARRTEALLKEAKQGGWVSSTASECLVLARLEMRWSAPGERRTGKLAEALLDALFFLGGRATLRELGVAIGREDRLRDLRPHLRALGEDQIIVDMGGDEYSLPEHWLVELRMLQEFNGEAAAAERQRAKHELQSQGFTQAWEAHEVLSKAERRKRQHWAQKKAEQERAARLREAGADGFAQELEKIDLLPDPPTADGAREAGESLTLVQPKKRAERLAKPENDACHAAVTPAPEPDHSEAAPELPAGDLRLLETALAEYLQLNPRASSEAPSWLAVALWADCELRCKPTVADVEVALAELGLAG